MAWNLTNSQPGRPVVGGWAADCGAKAPQGEEQMRINDMRIGLAVMLAALVSPTAAAAQAKPLALEVRGGLGWSMFDLHDGLGEVLDAAAEKRGWTGSADIYWTFAQRGAVYLGWNHAKWKCTQAACGSDGRLWSAGPEMGFKFSMVGDRSFAPWVRLGLLAHKAKFKEGPAPEENSVRTPGVELGVGTDLEIGDVLAIVPALRFYGYKAGWDIGTATKRVRKNIGWVQTDLGLQLRLGGE